MRVQSIIKNTVTVTYVAEKYAYGISSDGDNCFIPNYIVRDFDIERGRTYDANVAVNHRDPTGNCPFYVQWMRAPLLLSEPPVEVVEEPITPVSVQEPITPTVAVAPVIPLRQKLLDRIYNEIEGHGPLATSDIAQIVGMQSKEIGRDLDDLWKSGRIIRIACQKFSKKRPSWVYWDTIEATETRQLLDWNGNSDFRQSEDHL